MMYFGFLTDTCRYEKREPERLPFSKSLLSPSDWPTYVTRRYESVRGGSTDKFVNQTDGLGPKKKAAHEGAASLTGRKLFQIRRTCRPGTKSTLAQKS